MRAVCELGSGLGVSLNPIPEVMEVHKTCSAELKLLTGGITCVLSESKKHAMGWIHKVNLKHVQTHH